MGMHGRLSIGLVAAVACVALSACTSTPLPSDSPAAIDWQAERDEFAATHGELPDFGPPLSDADAFAALGPIADEAWSAVLASHPDAVRPVDGFVRWATDADVFSEEGADLAQTSELAACFTAHGALVDVGQTEDGGTALGASAETEEGEVGMYFCSNVAYPQRPPSPSPERAGYIYDYYVGYLVPCFEAHGVKQGSASPTRDQYIAEFTHQTWGPTYPEADSTDPALERDCIIPFPGFES
jgi:hypothetical protein